MKFKLWIHGFNGRMGQAIQEQLSPASEFELIGGSGKGYIRTTLQEKNSSKPEDLVKNLSKADCIIDFSGAEGNAYLLKSLIEDSSCEGKNILIGSTGLSGPQIGAWKKLAKTGQNKILFAPNTSLGILVLLKTAQKLAKIFVSHNFDVEIVESHHRHKVDSPSGTAHLLADGIANVADLKPINARRGQRQRGEIGIAALRGGSVFGEHEVKFMGDLEELGISHRALSRELFAKGALVLSKWLCQENNPAGYFELQDIELEDLL